MFFEYISYFFVSPTQKMQKSWYQSLRAHFFFRKFCPVVSPAGRQCQAVRLRSMAYQDAAGAAIPDLQRLHHHAAIQLRLQQPAFTGCALEMGFEIHVSTGLPVQQLKLAAGACKPIRALPLAESAGSRPVGVSFQTKFPLWQSKFRSRNNVSFYYRKRAGSHPVGYFSDIF